MTWKQNLVCHFLIHTFLLFLRSTTLLMSDVIEQKLAKKQKDFEYQFLAWDLINDKNMGYNEKNLELWK